MRRCRAIIFVEVGLLSLAGCGKEEVESERKEVPPEVEQRVSTPAKTEVSPGETAAHEPPERSFEARLDDEIDALDNQSLESIDLLENPVFKEYFDQLLGSYEMTDAQKKRFGDVVNLLQAVDAQNFDNPNRETRLGLSGEVANLLIDTRKSGDVGGFIDTVLGEIEGMAFDPIETPDGMASPGGVILHIDPSPR